MPKKGNSELKYTYTKAACSLTYFHTNMMVKLLSGMVGGVLPFLFTSFNYCAEANKMHSI